MRFTIVTFGSEGDTRPFVALASGLLARGHQVQLLGETSSLDIARNCGVSGLTLPGDVKETLPIENAYRDLTMKDIRKVLKATQELVNSNTTSWMKAIAEYAQTSDAVMYAGGLSAAG